MNKVHFLFAIADGETVVADVFTSAEARDARLVEMARDRWPSNPFSDEFEDPERFLEGADADAAREFIEFDEPDLDLFVDWAYLNGGEA